MLSVVRRWDAHCRLAANRGPRACLFSVFDSFCSSLLSFLIGATFWWPEGVPPSHTSFVPLRLLQCDAGKYSGSQSSSCQNVRGRLSLADKRAVISPSSLNACAVSPSLTGLLRAPRCTPCCAWPFYWRAGGRRGADITRWLREREGWGERD